MQIHHYAFAKAAIAATLTATVLAPRPAFSQSKPTTGGPDPVTASQQAAAQELINRGPEEDPNMPNLPYAIPGAPIHWSPRGHAPLVTFTKTPNGPGTYLGFNEKGSWIKNVADGKVYVWNIKGQSLTFGAANEYEVPMDLRNPSDIMKGRMLARAGQSNNAGTQVASNKGNGRTPYIPPSVAGDGNAQYAGAETHTDIPAQGTNAANPVRISRTFKGTGATIKAGMLTFTLDDPASADNGKPVSLNVTRSAMNNPNTAKPNGIAGAWMGEDPKNRDVVFSLYVQGEGGAVSGTMMTGIAAEALKRMMNANRQQ